MPELAAFPAFIGQEAGKQLNLMDGLDRLLGHEITTERSKFSVESLQLVDPECQIECEP